MPGSERSSQRLFPAFEVPGFRWFYLSGICWTWSRWGLAFVAAFHINDVTDSSRLVQLTGTANWAPMLLGGVIGGVIADRYDRIVIVRVQLAAMIPIVGGFGLLELTDNLEVWMVYPILALAGTAFVSDMTSRRSLVIDIVGTERLANAVALDSAAQSSGMIVGNLLGGVAVASVGVGSALLALAGLYVLGLALFFAVPRKYGRSVGKGSSWSMAEVREGFALAATNLGLRAILGVTVLGNFFFFAYFPAIQRVGDRLDASAGEVGLLASMTGFGMMTAALLIAVLRPHRSGRLYVAGMLFAMLMLVPFAMAGSMPVAMVALYVASIGSGFFGATQSALVLSVVPAEVRGRAMGLLGMSIGALPVGSAVLGELAEVWGIRTGLVAMTLTGFGLLVLWAATHRRILTMTVSAT